MEYLYYPIYNDNDVKSILENGIATDKYGEVVLYEKPYEKPVENVKKFVKINIEKILEDEYLNGGFDIYDYITHEHNNTETYISIPILPKYIECIIEGG